MRKFPQERRVFALALLDGSGTGAQNVFVGVLAAERFGLAVAGLVIGLYSLGRFASPFVFWFADRRAAAEKNTHALFRAAVAVMTVTSVASVFAAVYAAPWVIVAVGLVWALSNSVSSVVATSAVPKALTGYGPFSMVGVAVGAWGAAFAASTAGGSVSVWALAGISVALSAQLAEPYLISDVTFSRAAPPSVPETVRHATKGFVLSVFAYGPLLVYQALTLRVASVSWVGWAMAAYAAGALTAVPLSRRLTGFRTFAGVLLLGAVGVGVWAFAVSGPLLLVSRFVSGATLFIAQGRLLQIAFGESGDTSTVRLAGASTGLGVGASVGAVVAAALAANYSVPAMGAVLGAATVAAGGATAVVAAAKKKRSSLGA